MDEKQQARELYAIQQDRGYQNELQNLLKDMPTLNDMFLAKNPSEEEIAEKKSQEFDAYIKVHDKKLDRVTKSNYTKPKKKRK